MGWPALSTANLSPMSIKSRMKMQSNLQKVPTNIPPLGDDGKNSDEAITAVLNEYDDRDTTVTQAATANQPSAPTQPTKSRQLNPTCDSLRNLNVDDNVVMKGCLEEIPDRSVAGLSIDRSHIKFDV